VTLTNAANNERLRHSQIHWRRMTQL
jgi:hypothetical protein